MKAILSTPTPAANRLDPGVCYDALRARDPRFDGRFFVGVSSTRIYCRAICSARTPRREHCSFFASAALAERSGFRPCLRCRPELAPALCGVDAGARLAQAAAAAIEDGLLEQEGLAGIARRLGVSDRHLRRVFGNEFGVAPIDYAQTQRLLLAKRLLTDTALPVTEIALAAGFSSLRRFNDAFSDRYRLTPSNLRRQARAAMPNGALTAVDALSFRLAYRPPYDWNAMTEFLAARAIPGVESCEAGKSYRRVVRVTARRAEAGAALARRNRSFRDGSTVSGWIEVTRGRARSSRSELLVRLDPSLVCAIAPTLARVRRLFDLECRPDEVAAVLGSLAEGREGLRLAGAFDGFEVAVRAILGQQVSVKAARTLAGRFAAAFGDPVPTPWPDMGTAFPSAGRIAQTSAGDIAALGIVRQRARAIVALAAAVADGSLRLEPGSDIEASGARLRQIPGVGEWTVQYLAMRGLGWPDAFPAADLGVLKALGTRSSAVAARIAEQWRPWRAYAVMHLWLDPGAATAAVTTHGNADHRRLRIEGMTQ